MADGIKSRVDRIRSELNRSTAFLNTKWPRRVITTILVIVVLFMVIYYRRAGFVADE